MRMTNNKTLNSSNQISHTPRGYSVQSYANLYTYYIYGEIGPADMYVDLIDVLDNMTQNDVLNLHITTPGGYLDTAISIIHAMQRCQGTIKGYADGQVASAGTIIMLMCDEWIVSPYSYFMSHDASSGSIGKFSEQRAYIEHASKQIKTIYGDIYFPFFNMDEIDDILKGVDVYLDSEEMVERLKAVAISREEEIDKDYENCEDYTIDDEGEINDR